MPRFAWGACGKNRETGSVKERRRCERSLRIAAPVNPLVIEPMLNRLETVSGFPFCGEYAFSIATELFLAMRTTPEKPLSACALAMASRRVGAWAALSAEDTSARTPRTALITCASPQRTHRVGI